MINDRIEIYDGSTCLAKVASSMILVIGSKISVVGAVWEIVKIEYVIEHDGVFGNRMVADVSVKTFAPDLSY